MATIEVSTWNELVTAITETVSDGDTIKITADIECNDDIPYGVQSTINLDVRGAGGSRIYYTVDGEYTENGVSKRHIIRNLRTSTSNPVAIFQNPNEAGYAYCVANFYNIEFINLICDDYLFDSQNYGYNSMYPIWFNNCVFVGRRSNYLFNGGNAGVGFYQCYFDIPYKPLAGNSYSASAKNLANYANKCTASYSRFKESFPEDVIGNAFMSSADTSCSTFGMWLVGCFIEGEILSNNNYLALSNTSYANNNGMQNVTDVKIYLNYYGDTPPSSGDKAMTGTNCWKKGVCRIDNVHAFTSNGKDDTKTYKLTFSSLETYDIAADSSEMVDPAALYAKGFDIVVPSS